MAKPLNQILGYIPLTKAIQETTSGIPDPLPQEFSLSHQKCIGNKTRYVQYTGERRVARITKYGSPAKRRELRPVSERDIRLLHTFEDQQFDPLTIKYLRDANSYNLDMGLQEVKRQVREFTQLFVNLRI